MKKAKNRNFDRMDKIDRMKAFEVEWCVTSSPYEVPRALRKALDVESSCTEQLQ